ncbi:diguanylate cyclase (GGDEF)-like protein [Kineococcus xinjiangensis]|uniref:Diguanylate cyclase (GGDEF)-like protein n=1 Tax=Kineococcus xinjiangensis TaxID=512762 RepID=A0A2S6IUK8_9ACTN|nr:EAL domain-containing protein [Kineococcus xinjiangensis]PPK97825.1 diguanylate cyclase (GGDEF)-like protein [Kineococcus xinjiangensis]
MHPANALPEHAPWSRPGASPAASAWSAAETAGATRLLRHVLLELGGAASEAELFGLAGGLMADFLGADAVAFLEGEHLHGGVGLGTGAPPLRGLLRVVRDGGGALAVPGLGRVRAWVLPMPALSGVHCVIGWVQPPAPGSHAELLDVLSSLVGLTVLALHGAERERWMHLEGQRDAQEVSRLQAALSQREHVLTTSLQFQQAVSSRQPLPDLLRRIAGSASELLGERAVCLVLADPRSHMDLRVVAAAGDRPMAEGRALVAARTVTEGGTSQRPRDVADEDGSAVAVGIHISGRAVGALVVETSGTDALDDVGRTVVQAFAEHASMALTQAETLQAVLAASTDPLTRLPGRTTFLQQLRIALHRRAGGGDDVAVLFVDLDGFKPVNDGLGHAAGDVVLTRVARRLSRCLRGADVAARIGGDEFAVLVCGSDPAVTARRVAERVTRALAQSIDVEGRSVRVGCSTGIAVATGEESAEELLRFADVAMYRAKDGGGDGAVLFDSSMLEADDLRRALEVDLERLGVEEEFSLAFQPVVLLPDGAVVGVEALLRWEHPQRGLLEPGAFLALAEHGGALVRSTSRMLREAARQVAAWRCVVPGLELWVNLSAGQLAAPGTPEDLRRALHESGLEPSAVLVDLPRAVLGQDPDVLRARLAQLRGTGVRIALDDFGAGPHEGPGYLAPLRQLPVDAVKVDGSLVAGLGSGTGTGTWEAVRRLLELARALDLGVVAEGVETPEQLRALRELGCPAAQGNLLVPAGTAEAVGELLMRGSWAEGAPGAG